MIFLKNESTENHINNVTYNLGHIINAELGFEPRYPGFKGYLFHCLLSLVSNCLSFFSISMSKHHDLGTLFLKK